MSTITYTLEHISGKEHDRRLRRSRRHCQHCRTITNLPFADDIDGLKGKEEELAKFFESLNKAFTAYGI